MLIDSVDSMSLVLQIIHRIRRRLPSVRSHIPAEAESCQRTELVNALQALRVLLRGIVKTGEG